LVVYRTDDYIQARTLVDAPVPEDDLFAGIRDRVPSGSAPDRED
jgi:hypothetical protein